MFTDFRYSHLKAFHHPEALAQLRKGEIPGPVYAQMYLTNVCNTACHFCFYADNPNQNTFVFKEKLDFKIVENTLNQLHTMGTKSILLSGGGEPTAYPQFDEVLPILKEKGFCVGMNSNGKLLNKIRNYTDMFTYVRISLNAATPASFVATQKDSEASFHKIVGFMKELAPSTDLSIGFVVTDRNVEDVAAIAEMAREIGCKSIRYSLDVNVQHPPELKQRILTLMKEAKKLHADNFGVFTFDEKFEALTSKKNYSTCYYQYLVANIGADGGVYSCCHLSYNDAYKYGNLNEASFKDIWFGENRRQRLEKFNVKACPPCWMDRRNEALEYMVDSTPETHANFI